jgi:ABC-2 type transport system ATP-binding protein
MEDAQRVLARFSTDALHTADRSVTAPISGGAQTLTDVLRSLDTEGVKLRDAGLRRPTLDDVFLALTGHMTESADGSTATTDNEQETNAKQLVAMKGL